VNIASFQGCTALKSVDLRKVKNVQDYAFSGCTSLESINLNNVEYIGEGVFSRCTGLKEIVIPATVRKIDTYAFTDCTALENIVIKEDKFNETPLRIEEYAFRMCSSLTSITIPERTSRIHFDAFAQTPALSEIHGKREHLERVLPEWCRKFIVDAN
jgi:hypothetical protein